EGARASLRPRVPKPPRRGGRVRRAHARGGRARGGQVHHRARRAAPRPPRDRPADARRAAVARRARLRQDLRRAADGAPDPDRDQARAGRRDALRAAPRRRAGRDRRGPGRARVPLRAAQGAGAAGRAGLSVAHIGPTMGVVSMALCAVCAALLGTSGSPARLSAERLATASALGLALFLWLPYLSARAWGSTRGRGSASAPWRCSRAPAWRGSSRIAPRPPAGGGRTLPPVG